MSPDLGSSNHQPLPPEGGKMRGNEIVTESNVHCKQAKYAVREGLQMQDEIENARRPLYALYTSCTTLSMRSQTT
jgi:hypothetical protein